MSFKEKALNVLIEAEAREVGSASAVLRECREMVENIPDDEQKNTKCSAPNFEVMYREAMKKLEQCAKAQDSLFEENRCLKMELMQLHGFKNAVELIFRKNRDCHGRCETA